LAQALSRFDAEALAYCQMGNYYHFVLHTRQANLSLLMRQINGVYTQTYNRRHHKVGHLFQGRFKAILLAGGLGARCLSVGQRPAPADLSGRRALRRAHALCLAHSGSCRRVLPIRH
jgi:hypothetical protein